MRNQNVYCPKCYYKGKAGKETRKGSYGLYMLIALLSTPFTSVLGVMVFLFFLGLSVLGFNSQFRYTCPDCNNPHIVSQNVYQERFEKNNGEASVET